MSIKLVALVFLMLRCFCNAENPTVRTPLGLVQGHIKTSHDGRKFAAFEGIPFAKSPIGHRRFEKPESVEPWEGVWHADYRTMCPQFNLIEMDAVEGEEDCLYINVYVPRENPNSEENLDVIVHIHGGAYMVGSGTMFAPADVLMDRDVVYVTFNYRLGILGFLSTEDEVLPGNNGMKDQVMALKWVQENIGSFGGNPDSVTLTGLSAGGSSVHLHYLSDMSKGLFHRGFSQSGVALNTFSIQKGALAKAKLLAEAFGCPVSSTKKLVTCLKGKSAKQITQKLAIFYDYKMLPLAPFAPVVEKGSEPFLKSNPYFLLSKGNVLDLPWLVSNTAHEGHITVMMFPEDIKYYNKNWESVAPVLLDFNYTLNRAVWASTTQKITEFYFGNNQVNLEKDLDKLVQVYGDRTFITGAETSVKMQSKASESPVYYYYHTYPGESSGFKYVSHGSDALYFFGSFFNSKPLTKNELKLRQVLLDMLVSFAKEGTPLIKEVDWKPSKGDKLTYLTINSYEPEEFNMQTVEEFSPRSFWQSLGFSENENTALNKDEL